MISSLEVKIVQQITTNHFVIELFVWFSIFGALWNSVISTQYCAERKRSKNVNNKSQNLPIFKSWGPDCKLMTSTAHLAAMTCCNASVLSSPRLHLLVKIFLLDSSWPGCCLCRLTSTPVEEKKKKVKIIIALWLIDMKTGQKYLTFRTYNTHYTRYTFFVKSQHS